jgi:hypothetical protein
MLFIFSTPVLIRHLWQFKEVVFLHWCLICAAPLPKWESECFYSAKFPWFCPKTSKMEMNPQRLYFFSFQGAKVGIGPVAGIFFNYTLQCKLILGYLCLRPSVGNFQFPNPFFFKLLRKLRKENWGANKFSLGHFRNLSQPLKSPLTKPRLSSAALKNVRALCKWQMREGDQFGEFFDENFFLLRFPGTGLSL